MTAARSHTPTRAAPLELVSYTAVVHYAQRILLKVADEDFDSMFPTKCAVSRLSILEQAERVCLVADVTPLHVANLILSPGVLLALSIGVPRVFAGTYMCRLIPFEMVQDVSSLGGHKTNQRMFIRDRREARIDWRREWQ